MSIVIIDLLGDDDIIVGHAQDDKDKKKRMPTETLPKVTDLVELELEIVVPSKRRR